MKFFDAEHRSDIGLALLGLVGFLVFLAVATATCNNFDHVMRNNWSAQQQADKEAWLLECVKYRPLADCRVDYAKVKGTSK